MEWREYLKSSSLTPTSADRRDLWRLRATLGNPGLAPSAFEAGLPGLADWYWAWLLENGDHGSNASRQRGDLYVSLNSAKEGPARLAVLEDVLQVWSAYGTLLAIPHLATHLATLRDLPTASHRDAWPTILAALCIAALSGMPAELVNAHEESFHRERITITGKARSWTASRRDRIDARDDQRDQADDLVTAFLLVQDELIKGLRRGWYPIENIFGAKLADAKMNRGLTTDPNPQRRAQGGDQDDRTETELDDREPFLPWGPLAPESAAVRRDELERRERPVTDASDAFREHLTGAYGGVSSSDSGWPARLLEELSDLYGRALTQTVTVDVLVAADNWLNDPSPDTGPVTPETVANRFKAVMATVDTRMWNDPADKSRKSDAAARKRLQLHAMAVAVLAWRLADRAREEATDPSAEVSEGKEPSAVEHYWQGVCYMARIGAVCLASGLASRLIEGASKRSRVGPGVSTRASHMAVTLQDLITPLLSDKLTKGADLLELATQLRAVSFALTRFGEQTKDAAVAGAARAVLQLAGSAAAAGADRLVRQVCDCSLTAAEFIRSHPRPSPATLKHAERLATMMGNVAGAVGRVGKIAPVERQVLAEVVASTDRVGSRIRKLSGEYAKAEAEQEQRADENAKREGRTRPKRPAHHDQIRPPSSKLLKEAAARCDAAAKSLRESLVASSEELS